MVDLTHMYVQVLMHPKRKLDPFCGRVRVLFFQSNISLFYWLNTRLVGSVFGCWLIVYIHAHPGCCESGLGL